MHRYKKRLALCGLVLMSSTYGAIASTTASEKAAQRSDAATTSSEMFMATPTAVPAWLVGAWTLVRCDNVYPDGLLVELYGPNPQGLWIIDSQGHYMMQMVRAERGRFAANDKSKGTADEYRAASLDTNAHYGWISADGAQLHMHITHASYPNWDDRQANTNYQLQGNELTYSVSKPTSGASEDARGVVVWRRLTD